MAFQSHEWTNGIVVHQLSLFQVIQHNTISPKHAFQTVSSTLCETYYNMYVDYYMNISIRVYTFHADLSLKNFPLPNLTEFLNIDSYNPSSVRNLSENLQQSTDGHSLPRNQWFYQFEKKMPTTFNSGSRLRSDRESRTNGSETLSWTSLIAALVFVDLVWFVHRMARTYSTAKLLLYGTPVRSEGLLFISILILFKNLQTVNIKIRFITLILNISIEFIL